jgi:glycogen operon protein
MKLLPGQPYPLGATFDGIGVNFAVFSEAAERVELCLFDDAGNETRVDLPEVTSYCWHGYLPTSQAAVPAGEAAPGDANGRAGAAAITAQPGLRYGFRVHGPWAPERGQRHNAHKLLLDPYAKAVEGAVRWDEAVFSHLFSDPDARNDADSAPFVPRSVVVNPFFDWGSDRHPNTPWHPRSSTRRTSRVSPHAIPICLPSFAAPMRALPTRSSSTTCAGSA